MQRDSKGRFMTKDEEGNKIVFYMPSLRRIVLWLLILWVILPWISIISKFNIISNILDIFDRLISKTKGEAGETGKKNGIFF